MDNLKFIFGILLVGLMMFSACNIPPDPTYPECVEDRDCLSGEVCDVDICVLDRPVCADVECISELAHCSYEINVDEDGCEYCGILNCDPQVVEDIVIEAEDGVVDSPMVIVDEGGVKFIRTETSSEGFAIYYVDVKESGKYKIYLTTRALDTGKDSFFIGFSDSVNDNDEFVFDIPKSQTFEEFVVNLRGPGGDFDNAVYSPMVWDLNKGSNTLYVFGREHQTDLDKIRIVKTDGSVVPVVNKKPVVSAGKDFSVEVNKDVQLQGVVSDDGKPNNVLSKKWTKISGPGNVIFEDDSWVDTGVAFKTAGTYVLRLTVDDGELKNSDDLTVTVNPAGVLETCDDNIKNQGEEKVDCGGPNCPACVVDPVDPDEMEQLGSGTTYYVSTSGSDSNDGKSESKPWKTLKKVNSMMGSFKPGDNVLFKRGDKFEEGITLKITVDGTKDKRILFGAYGSGAKPIISLQTDLPGWKDSSNWEIHNSDKKIWKMDYSVGGSGNSGRYPLRAWFDGVEYSIAQTRDETVDNAGANPVDASYYRNTPNRYVGVDEEDRFWYGFYNTVQRFYVYAEQNPATYYDSMKIGTTKVDNYAIYILGADYITLQNLDVRYGHHTINVAGSDYVIIENNEIYYPAEIAIWLRHNNRDASDYAIIRNNYVDSKFSEIYDVKKDWSEFGYNFPDYVGPYDYYSINHMGKTSSTFLTVSFGVGTWGSDYSKIYNNEFIDFYFAGVRLYGDDDANSNYNEIYDNKITMDGINMGRGVHMSAARGTAEIDDGRVSYNKVYRNFIEMPGINAFQISGDNNEFYYNIINHGRMNDPPLYGGRGDGASILGGADSGSNSNDNKFYNNVFYDMPGFGMGWMGKDTQVINNIFLNVNTNAQGRNTLYLNVDNRGNIYKNNLFFYEGKSLSDDLVNYGNSGKPNYMTVNEFNSLNGDSSDVISGNIQYVGNINDVVVDAKNGNFKLKAGSPAINKGTNVGLSSDYVTNSIVGVPDIGAFEYR